MKKLFACLALLALGACGGVTTSASPTLKPTKAQNYFTGVGGGLGGTVPTGPAGPITTITHSNGTAFVGVMKLGPGGSTFGMAQDGSADGMAFDVVAFSDDGKAFHGASNIVSATVIASSTASTPGFGQLATFRRDSNSVLPTSSVGTFTGDYRGTIGQDGVAYNDGTTTYDSGAPVAISGSVTLTANFNSQTVSGVINGRQILLVNRATGATLGIVTLDSSSINGNGLFSGTASDTGTATGMYYGLIGGANGTGIAGALVLNHALGFTEIGVFTANR